MIKIIKIEKKKRLYKVEFDKSETIYVTEDTIVRYMMSKGSEFSEADLKEITDFANFSREKNLAIYYISFKMRTKMEVILYLKEHKIDNHQIAKIITSLEESKYINDENYTESFINSKINSQGTGPQQIKQKLLAKGISRDLVESKLADLLGYDKQLELAQELAEKLVMQKYQKLPLKMLKIKISQNLINKGFSYDIAKEALTALDLESDSQIEDELFEKDFNKILKRYQNKYTGYDLKQRITAALARKGYDFDLINRNLREFDF
ncbi:recombination regulator RecX [Streptococcaceae bacterium ESL0687]|nr:recombination regulator RecX [Streptococcaceae bacterium ESL0687]